MEEMIGKQLGSGGTSNVYEWGKHEVIKIYKPHVSENMIQNERRIGELLNHYSLEIPKLIRTVPMNGKTALIYERIHGTIMAEQLLKGRYEPELAYKFAEMHYGIHKKAIVELSPYHDFLQNRILELKEFLGGRTEALLHLLERIPDDHKLCHGDYQPLNILRVKNKYFVIDWNGACSGNPVLDVAWSYMTLHSPAIKYLLGEAVSNSFTGFTNDYIVHYSALSGIPPESIFICLPITAVRRLYDNLTYENETARLEKDWLMNMIDSCI